MPIRIEIDDKVPNLVWQLFEGKWTSDEYIQSVDELLAYIAQHEATIDLIADMTHSGTPPAQLLSLSGYLERKTPDNRGIVVIINSGLFIQALLRVMETIAPRFTRNMHTVDSADEAYAIIAAARMQEAPQKI